MAGNNQFNHNPSFTYEANHIRLRKVRGKARDRKCVRCLENKTYKRAAEWAQIHCTDGSDPWADYVALCHTCHRLYDRAGEAVAASNRRRKGESKGYTIRNPEVYFASQRAKALKRWGQNGK